MKAITLDRYGSVNVVLKVTEIEKPTPTGRQVLIEVSAAAVNQADYQLAQGEVRLFTGFFRPKIKSLGYDLAGHVEAVGEGVTRFKPGDKVFGLSSRDPIVNSQSRWMYDYGSFADYALTHEGALAPKPDNLTFEQAAAVPTAALVALQGLRTAVKVSNGQKVLISSATGGIGTFAVQIAKAFGAEVTGVCSTGNIELVRSLGADFVVDYTKEDYSKLGRRYDVVFDSVGTLAFSALRRILTPEGKVVFVGMRNTKGASPEFVGRFLLTTILPGFVFDFTRPDLDDLLLLSELLSAGKIKPVVAKTYNGLSEVPKAIQHVKDGHAWGKIVVTL